MPAVREGGPTLFLGIPRDTPSRKPPGGAVCGRGGGGEAGEDAVLCGGTVFGRGRGGGGKSGSSGAEVAVVVGRGGRCWKSVSSGESGGGAVPEAAVVVRGGSVSSGGGVVSEVAVLVV